MKSNVEKNSVKQTGVKPSFFTSLTMYLMPSLFRNKDEKLNKTPQQLQDEKRLIREYQLIEQLEEFVFVKQEEMKNYKQVNLLRLEEHKESFLKCSVFSLDYFTNPIVTSCGHYFENTEMNVYVETIRSKSPSDYTLPCPCCSHNLKDELILPDPQMQAAAESVKIENKELLAKLETAPSLREIKQYLMEYEDKLDKKIEFFNRDDKRKSRYHHLYVSDRIEALKLDKKNINHLESWHKEAVPGWFGYGGDEIKHEATGRVFRIPRPVYMAMQVVAAKQYSNKDQFSKDVSLALRSKESNPFGYYYRKPKTNLLCSAKSIDEVDLRRPMV